MTDDIKKFRQVILEAALKPKLEKRRAYLERRLEQHIDKYALKWTDLEPYVGKTIKIWMEGHLNSPYQVPIKVKKDNKGIAVILWPGKYKDYENREEKGDENFVILNSAADYSWLKKQYADTYGKILEKIEDLDN